MKTYRLESCEHCGAPAHSLCERCPEDPRAKAVIAEQQSEIEAQRKEHAIRHKFDATCACDFCECRKEKAVLEIGLASQTDICNQLRQRAESTETQLTSLRLQRGMEVTAYDEQIEKQQREIEGLRKRLEEQ